MVPTSTDPDDTFLGAILVQKFDLSLESLQDALEIQRKDGTQLGAVLRKMKAITGGQLLRALEIQNQMRHDRKRSTES